MMTYEERNQRIISGLNPVVAARCRKALLILDGLGYDVLLTSGRRTQEEQDALFAQGRTKPGKIVTHVRGSSSFHVWGVAFDLVPIRFGRARWNDIVTFKNIARIMVSLDFEWGYRMWGFDYGHFQYTQGGTIRDFKNGKKLMEEPADLIEVEDMHTPYLRRFFRRLEQIIIRFGFRIVAKTKRQSSFL